MERRTLLEMAGKDCDQRSVRDILRTTDSNIPAATRAMGKKRKARIIDIMVCGEGMKGTAGTSGRRL